PLVCGHAIEMIPEGPPVDVVIDAARSGAFAFMKMTPSHLDVLNHGLTEEEMTGCMRALVTGGESLQTEQLAPWWRASKEIRVFNEYGPTETTVGCTVFAVPRDYPFGGVLPLGSPI